MGELLLAEQVVLGGVDEGLQGWCDARTSGLKVNDFQGLG